MGITQVYCKEKMKGKSQMINFCVPPCLCSGFWRRGRQRLTKKPCCLVSKSQATLTEKPNQTGKGLIQISGGNQKAHLCPDG